MKKYKISILSILLITLLLCGCSNKEKNNKSSKQITNDSVSEQYLHNTTCTYSEAGGTSAEGIIHIFLYISLDYNKENEKANCYSSETITFDNFENAEKYYLDNISSWTASNHQVELDKYGAINIIDKYTTTKTSKKTINYLESKGYECETKDNN